jgi:hypothetical protein
MARHSIQISGKPRIMLDLFNTLQTPRFDLAVATAFALGEACELPNYESNLCISYDPVRDCMTPSPKEMRDMCTRMRNSTKIMTQVRDSWREAYKREPTESEIEGVIERQARRCCMSDQANELRQFLPEEFDALIMAGRVQVFAALGRGQYSASLTVPIDVIEWVRQSGAPYTRPGEQIPSIFPLLPLDSGGFEAFAIYDDMLKNGASQGRLLIMRMEVAELAIRMKFKITRYLVPVMVEALDLPFKGTHLLKSSASEPHVDSDAGNTTT